MIIIINLHKKSVPSDTITLINHNHISLYSLASYDPELLSSKESGFVYRGMNE